MGVQERKEGATHASDESTPKCNAMAPSIKTMNRFQMLPLPLSLLVAPLGRAPAQHSEPGPSCPFLGLPREGARGLPFSLT